MKTKLQGTTDEHRYFEGVFSYVDENGEARMSIPTATHKAVNLEQSRSFKEEQERKNWQIGRQHDFTGSNMRNLSEVYSILTTAQCGYLMRLQCNVSFDGGTLVTGNSKTPMTTKDMIDVLQLKRKRSTFYNFLNACLDNGIITESDGVFAVNPRYHFRGAFNDQYVVKAYTTKLKQVYREVKAADIGLIYRMLPFVHYETNALCKNPFEQDPKKITWFSRKELAEAIGVKPDTLGRRLKLMKFDSEYVVARIKIGSEPERYTFNPKVFYRKNSEPEKSLQAMFNVNK